MHKQLRNVPLEVLVRTAIVIGLFLAGGLGNVNKAAAQNFSKTDTLETKKPTQLMETMVVSGSRREQMIQQAPAAMSVIGALEIENSPANNVGDLLRNVPGLNIAQMSARDVQIAGRGATGSLSTSQLVLVDGRTIYLDFFGFVMWDFLPTDTREIKQIEVVRGPGSAVWGANALTGVVNVITKSPREMLGTTVVAGGGARRHGDFDKIESGYFNVTHAGMRDKLSYKVSGGFYKEEALDRPQGTIPGSSTPYPAFENQGTQQPKFDFRLDYEQDEKANWSFSGGYAGTDGILHSGIGPFDVDSGTFLSYGRASYNRNTTQVDFFVNVLDGDATNLLTRDPAGKPLSFKFATQTYNLGATNFTVVEAGDLFTNVITYGANVRANTFDLELAPQAKDRNEIGTFLEDEIVLSEKLRFVAGVRWDNFDPIGSVFSPRSSVLYSPVPEHTFRVSFNRAFRAPSVMQNFLKTTIVNNVTLPPAGSVFQFSSEVRGNENLDEETMTAFELGWAATLFERASLSFSVYRNERQDTIDFYPMTFYSAAEPPTGLPPEFVPPNTFPKSFSYRNIGQVVDRGFEFGVKVAASAGWTTFMNYSWQDDPDVEVLLREEISTPPRHRVNLGVAYDGPLFFANGNVNFVDHAFWTDVLDARFWGPTDSYRQLNVSAGAKLLDDRLTLLVRSVNVLDENIQQHVFGDIVSRKMDLEARIQY